MRASSLLSAFVFGIATAQVAVVQPPSVPATTPAPTLPPPAGLPPAQVPPGVQPPSPDTTTTTQLFTTTTRTIVRVMVATMTAVPNATTGTDRDPTTHGASQPDELIGKNSASRDFVDLSLAGLAGIALTFFYNLAG